MKKPPIVFLLKKKDSLEFKILLADEPIPISFLTKEFKRLEEEGYVDIMTNVDTEIMPCPK